jgi:protein-disulfide isomerase
MKKLAIAIVVLLIAGGLVFAFAKKAPTTTPAVEVAQTTTETTTPADQTETAADMNVAPAPVAAPTETATVETAVETVATTETEAAPAADTTVAVAPETLPATSPAVISEAAPAPAATDSLLAAPAALNIDVPKIMEDRVIGSLDAPVTIVEYASMTCPHCAHFAMDILPEVKTKLIESGKAKLIFREFPLDKYALKAAMMARCAPPEKFFDLIEVIFRNQDRWVKAENPEEAVSQLGTLAGMDKALINACMNNAELESTILARMQDGQTRYNIQQTPAFVFNNGRDMFSGGQNVAKFEEVVNALSKGQ